jgi:hypothetical protein
MPADVSALFTVSVYVEAMLGLLLGRAERSHYRDLHMVCRGGNLA